MKNKEKKTIEVIEKGENFSNKELSEIIAGSSCFIKVNCTCKGGDTNEKYSTECKENKEKEQENEENNKSIIEKEKEKNTNKYCFIVFEK
ncbi:MAG: hypothetical protein ACOXZK_06255 [Bacteroidales bacterium]|jgi:hypothetical protein|nr:hypothetical protein [Bacteroidales bacterium]